MSRYLPAATSSASQISSWMPKAGARGVAGRDELAPTSMHHACISILHASASCMHQHPACIRIMHASVSCMHPQSPACMHRVLSPTSGDCGKLQRSCPGLVPTVSNVPISFSVCQYRHYFPSIFINFYLPCCL